MKGESNAFLIYQDDNGVSNVNVRFEGEDVWLTAEQLQQLFQASQQDVSHHIQQIYADGELLAEATNKKYLLVRNEGNRSVNRNILHYNLDMILAIGMRIRSDVATRFRQWAIRHLHEFTAPGWVRDENGALRRFIVWVGGCPISITRRGESTRLRLFSKSEGRCWGGW